MKDYPQNIEQWAQEAYQSLDAAWFELKQYNPYPTEKQKEKLFDIAVNMACANREITDQKHIEHAHSYVKEVFFDEFNERDPDQIVNYSWCFLMAYFDAHLSLTMIDGDVAGDALTYLENNYDMDYEGLVLANGVSINFPAND